MKYRWVGLLVVLLVFCGCVRIDIGDDKIEATVGDQLVDLLAAKKAGVLSETEFDHLKQALKQKFLDSF